MRPVWVKTFVMGSAAFGSALWTQRRSKAAETDLDANHENRGQHPDYELKLVQVLFRHGARTPLKSIPDVLEAQWIPNLLKAPVHTQIDYVVTDLSGGPQPPAPIEESYRSKTLSGGTFPGQLTTLGMQQLYGLGERLRKTYIQDFPFLTPCFNPAEVLVRSTNIVRTIESARCLVAGLFQQKQQDPITILTTEAENEILYPNYHYCLLLKVLGGPRWAEFSQLPNIAADLKNIQSDLGITTQGQVDFILIRDDMIAREAHGLPSPPILDRWRSTVEQRAVEMMCHLYEPNKAKNLQLSVGPLLHTLMSNIEAKVQDTPSARLRKMFLYSVHDTTLMPCLMAMGIFDMKWPPYAADITLELHQHRGTKQAFVKVSYLGKDQQIPGCSDVYCPLEEFKKVMSAYVVSFDHYKSLCQQTERPRQP